TSPLTYQWQLNGANLTDSVHISGSRSNILTINAAQLSDEGAYVLVVTNAAGPATSSTVSLTVLSSGGSFVPIPLTIGSTNQDIALKITSWSPWSPGVLTTASMDGGNGNTGSAWYERGFNLGAPATGLPAAGSTITSLSHSNHLYRLASGYAASNNV